MPDNAALAAFGASWLGWDLETGASVPHPDVPGLPKITATPRKYGFHGTLKPPFRLAEGVGFEDLREAVAGLAARLRPATLEGLELAEIGRFLALVPRGEANALADLAFTCVTELDRFRAEADAAEIAKRRAGGLSPRQDAMLLTWGYPYVGEEFRFHMTLSSKLDASELARARNAVARLLPDPPEPFEIGSISLVGERKDGMFQLIHRCALSG